ncbi:MAG TPA: nucleotidyltransferase family protein [Gemmatimonadaceae bacterium]|nr:nucleotidyltransferase family protein [Gemmatimonadaceae bacterium]
MLTSRQAEPTVVTKAVILARGLGTRMRARDDAAALAPEQAAVADTGVKAMIPIGRPFLDYVLSALADAGYRDVCLVIGPEHHAIRDYYTRDVACERVRMHFAIQAQPLGTADAVLAAESFAGGEPFVALNSDNYYPVPALAALRTLCGPALLAFGREALVRDGHIPPERIARFALLDIDSEGYLTRIVEKPDDATFRALGSAAFVSMNCWLLTPEILRACREIGPSPRGELELPLAVQHAIDAHGVRVKAVPVHATVLDLSSRADIAGVAAQLRGVDVRL